MFPMQAPGAGRHHIHHPLLGSIFCLFLARSAKVPGLMVGKLACAML